MHALLVTHRFPPDGVGGVERYVELLARELRAQGDRTTVLARRPTHWPRRPGLRGGAGVVRIVGSGVRLDEPDTHATRMDKLLSRVLASVSPDVVHVNHLIGLSPRTIPIAQSAGSAVVLTLHDYYFACPLVHLEKRTGGHCAGPAGGIECERTCFAHHPRDGRWRARESHFRALLSAADAVTAPSVSVADFFERHSGGAVRPMVVPLGTWASGGAVGPRVRDSRELRLAILGTLSRHKGAHVAIDALRLGDVGDVRLELWGRSDDRTYATELRQAAASVPRLTVEFGGEYRPEQLAEILAGVDAVLAPSVLREASPIVPREALAHGVPVLVARIGGLTESVIEGVNGLMFEPSDPADLGRVLRRFAHDHTLVDALTAGARSTPVRTAADNAREMHEIYIQAATARTT